jgi:hypothetical protein
MSDRRGFLVSASGVIKHAWCRPSLSSSRRPGRTAADTTLRPSGELDLHRRLQALLQQRALTVLHLHPTHIVAALYAGHRLAELSADFPEVTRYTRVGPTYPALPATSEELAEACEAAFRQPSARPPTSSAWIATAWSPSARPHGRPSSTWSDWNTSAASPSPQVIAACTILSTGSPPCACPLTRARCSPRVAS